MAKETKKKDNQVNYEKQRELRKILEEYEPSFQLAMAARLAGYHPQPVNIPTMLRSARDITLIL